MTIKGRASVACLVLASVWMTAPPANADTFEWDGDCTLPTWWAQCAPAGILKSNWTQDPLRPGGADTVFIDLGSGVTRLGNSFTIKQCTVPGGLEIEGANNLTLTEGGSNITDLMKTGGRITLESGVTLLIFGISSFGGEFWGPGHFIVNGVVNFNGCQIENQATITMDSATGQLWGAVSIAEDSFLEGNLGELFHIYDGADIFGDGGEISNLYFTVGPTGVQTTHLDPDLVSVSVEVGDDADVLIRSERLLLDSIFTIGTGSEVTIAQTFGGTDRTVTAPNVEGAGLLTVLTNFVVGDGVTMDLGNVPAATGGLHLNNATFDLLGTLTNAGRFRFNWGTITGVGPFINSPGASAYTLSSGVGFSFVEVQNQGFFNVSNQFFINDAQFINTGELRFFVVSGGMSMEGTGTVVNQGDFLMDGDFTANGFMACDFDNQPGGTVTVINGHLMFTGDLLNFNADGTLTGGTWAVTEEGILWMPNIADISTASGATFEVMNTGQIPGLAGLSELTDGSVLSIRDGAEITINPIPFLADHGSLIEIDAGSRFRVQWPALFKNSATLSIAEGGQAEFWQGLDLGDTQTTESVIPELQGVTVLLKNGAERGVTPVVEATTLNNHGRILPAEREITGTMQLVGDYVQHINGHLHIDTVGGEADLLEIDGHAALDGILELGRVAGSDPVIGQPYTVLTTTGAVTGEFEEVEVTGVVQVTYNPQSVVVVFDALEPIDIFSDGFESGDASSWSDVNP